MSRLLNCRLVCGSAGLVALGLASQAGAQTQLLKNPGFELPPSTSSVDSTCNFWTFVFDCQRAKFFNHTPSGSESIWIKTFEDPVTVTDGIYQNVNNITAGSNYTLSAFTLFENGYNESGATVQMGMIWLDSGNQPV